MISFYCKLAEKTSFLKCNFWKEFKKYYFRFIVTETINIRILGEKNIRTNKKCVLETNLMKKLRWKFISLIFLLYNIFFKRFYIKKCETMNRDEEIINQRINFSIY